MVSLLLSNWMCVCVCSLTRWILNSFLSFFLFQEICNTPLLAAMIRMTNCCNHWPHFPVSKEKGRRKEFLMEREHQRASKMSDITNNFRSDSRNRALQLAPECVHPLNCSILLDYHRLAWRSVSHRLILRQWHFYCPFLACRHASSLSDNHVACELQQTYR